MKSFEGEAMTWYAMYATPNNLEFLELLSKTNFFLLLSTTVTGLSVVVP